MGAMGIVTLVLMAARGAGNRAARGRRDRGGGEVERRAEAEAAEARALSRWWFNLMEPRDHETRR
jgi:hypothetical protein